jgi:hypothetical protein
MKLNQLTIEELVELRTQMILEKKSTKQINQIIDKKEKEYIYSIIEDTSATGGPAGAVSGGDVGSGGVAFANAGIGGMGDVTSAQPSSYAGSTIGSNWANHGGTIGWLADDEELAAECERVELAVEAKIVNVMRKAALGGDMKTAQWYLERRYPDRWGRRIAPDGDDQAPRYSDDVLRVWMAGAKSARRRGEPGNDEG